MAHRQTIHIFYCYAYYMEMSFSQPTQFSFLQTAELYKAVWMQWGGGKLTICQTAWFCRVEKRPLFGQAQTTLHVHFPSYNQLLFHSDNSSQPDPFAGFQVSSQPIDFTNAAAKQSNGLSASTAAQDKSADKYAALLDLDLAFNKSDGSLPK